MLPMHPFLIPHDADVRSKKLLPCQTMHCFRMSAEYGCETECTDVICVSVAVVCASLCCVFLHSSAGHLSLGTYSLHAILSVLQVLSILFWVQTKKWIHEKEKSNMI